MSLDPPPSVAELGKIIKDGVTNQIKWVNNYQWITWFNNLRDYTNQPKSDKSWAFDSPSGTTGDFWFGGFYDFASSDNDFNPSITFGTANASYAAHFFVVTAAGGGGGTDTVVRVTGTRINDEATRTTSYSADITIPHNAAAGTYIETPEKFIGQVTVAKQSGPDLLCNYGWSKYWDNNNSDFILKGSECIWLGGANDSGFNIRLIHHKSTGWTYNAGSVPSFSHIAELQTDHVTEYQVKNNENGAWKRTNYNQLIKGSEDEGTLFCITTTANRAIELGNLMITITPP